LPIQLKGVRRPYSDALVQNRSFARAGESGSAAEQKTYNLNMERKIFWGSMTVLGLLADLILPLWWAVGATIPIIYFSWWIAYRSGWFE
jgi:hypothetical protein